MKKFLTRRQALQQAAVGFGAMAVNSMFQQEQLFAAEAALAKERRYDLKPKAPHFAPKAKRVIFIYIGGGPSTIDMFDPKPALMKYDGKPAPFQLTLGLSDGTFTEILRGDLKEGQEVIVGLAGGAVRGAPQPQSGPRLRL